jgi:tetratricopeptide (TPR) repeat protein
MHDSAAATLTLPPVTPSAYVPTDARGVNGRVLRRVEALIERSQYAEALEVLGELLVSATAQPDHAVRALYAESWARMYIGELDVAEALLERARALVEAPAFTDAERGEALFRLGCVRTKSGRTSNAVLLFTEALRLAAGDEALEARVLEWRSRCYQVQREWDAARADAERAVELAESAGDEAARANALFQCSLVAERGGNPLLARFYAEEAREVYARLGDREGEARILNNLGGLSFLLDEAEQAVAYLKQSFAVALEVGNDADAAQAVSSLAQVHLRCGAPQLAEEQALHALSILERRGDYLDELGSVHLVLGRALLDQGRADEAMHAFAAAEWTFERLGSRSHVAAAWTAQADVYRARGELQPAAELYRRAAEALQDVHF